MCGTGTDTALAYALAGWFILILYFETHRKHYTYNKLPYNQIKYYTKRCRRDTCAL